MHTLEHGAAALPVPPEMGLDAQRAVARALGSARASSAATELFGSFMLGASEFALPASSLREVVTMPGRIIPVPLSPACLEGVFTLRGQVIPVLNLARMFDPGAPAPAPTHKVAIVDHDGIQIGLLFHDIGEVLRVRPEQRSLLQHRSGDRQGVIAGTIMLDDGARLLQVLDAQALVHIENVPQVQALRATQRGHERSQFHRLAERRQCLSFKVGGTAFAFEMCAIREIIAVPELQPSVMGSALCMGRINFRGSAIAVIDFAALLGFAGGTAESGAARRILVARIGEEQIGFLVDSVDSIFNFFSSDVLPIPLLSNARGRMFAGCISREEAGDILFLDHQAILSGAELREISQGHTNLYQQEAAAAQSQARTSRAQRQVYIAFTLEDQWAVDIRQVREIIPFAEGMVQPPGLPRFVHGILNLRHQVITVIDLRSLYGMDACPEGTARKIMIVEHGEERYGLIVDAVDSIVTVNDSARRSSPRMLRGAAGGNACQPSEVLEVRDAASHDSQDILSVFERSAFLACLANALAA